MARLHFTAFVLSKNIDENKMPKFTLLFNYFAGLDFFPHLGFLTLARSVLPKKQDFQFPGSLISPT